MQPQQQGDPVITLIMFAALMIPVIVAVFFLAKKKGYSPLWALLAIIPGVGFGVIIYFIGCPDRLLEKRLTDVENFVASGPAQ